MPQIPVIKGKLALCSMYLKNLLSTKRSRLLLVIALSIIAAALAGSYFVSKDEFLYKRDIAKILAISDDGKTKGSTVQRNDSSTRHIKAVLMNGAHKDEKVVLEDNSSDSQAFSLRLKANDEVFVAIHEGAGGKLLSATILDMKRDKYLAYAVILFMALILIIGGMKGLRSLASVIANVSIFLGALYLMLNGINAIFLSSLACLMFVIFSMVIVTGANKKAVSAILGTLAGTIASLLITLLVIICTHTKGLGYQESDFLSSLPQSAGFTVQQIFMIEIVVGTLGAIMDIAISMSSAIKELYDTNPCIENKILIKSGMQIGKDIMGTMANTLIFAYISGSIPMILVLLKNNISLSSIFSYYISLETIRALTGSIGIVISIPITLFVSIMLLKKRKIGDVI